MIYHTLLTMIFFVIILAGIVIKHPNLWFGGGAVLGVFLTLLLSFFGLLNFLLNRLAQKSVVLSVGILVCLLLISVMILTVSIIKLIHNTAVMKTREGKNFTGKLSAFFGVNLILLVPVFLFLIQANNLFVKIFLAIIFWEDFFWSSLFVGYLGYAASNQLLFRPKRPDYLIILGSWAGEHGQLPPLLKSRVDLGWYWYQYFGSKAKFVVTGGKGDDEDLSEAASIKNYLHKRKNVPSKQIILESQARSTRENIIYSKKLIYQDWNEKKDPRIYFVTSNYHVLRTMLIARKEGLSIRGLGAPTSFYFLPSALLREFIALLFFYRNTTIGVFLFLMLIVSWSFL